MLRIDRAAEAHLAASPECCRALLTDVAGYPSWTSLIERAVPADGAGAVPGRNGSGRDGPDGGIAGTRRAWPAGAIAVTGRIFGLELAMVCVLEDDGDTVVLRRLPYAEDDDERYVATWSVTPRERGADVRLHVEAALDAPGPASLVQGRVGRRLVDELLVDLVRAL